MDRRVLVLSACAALVLAACARSGSAGGDGGGGAPRVEILGPAEGADVTSPIELRLAVQGAEIGDPSSGLMHFHVYVGDSGEPAVVTSTTGEVPAPRGEQTIRVVLADPNHEETDVSAEVTVNVTSGSTATGGYTKGGGGNDYGGRYGGGG